MMTEEQHLANALTAFIGRPLDNPLSRSEIMETARIALAALTQPASPALKLPDGWVAVPREATREMIESGWTYSVLEKNATAKGTWACMVAAAPAVPHTAPIEPICATGGAEWVKVNERLPEKSGIYWCFFGNEKCSAIQQRVMTFSAHYKEFNDYGVTHWMPRPAAPTT